MQKVRDDPHIQMQPLNVLRKIHDFEEQKANIWFVIVLGHLWWVLALATLTLS